MGRLLDRTFGVRPRASRIVHALGLDQPSIAPYHRSTRPPIETGLIFTARAPHLKPWRLGERHFLPGLIAPTEALQERRCLGILHRLVLCSGVCYGPDLCPRIWYGPDVSVLLRGPDLWSVILLGRPSLELLEQGIGRRLTDFGLTLICRFKNASVQWRRWFEVIAGVNRRLVPRMFGKFPSLLTSNRRPPARCDTSRCSLWPHQRS
jgi:hypothetical protein